MNLIGRDVTAAEGDAGTTAFNFAGQPVGAGGSRRRHLRRGDRGRHGDGGQRLRRAAAHGAVRSRPARRARRVNVTVNGDTAVEPNETFSLNVTNVTGATVLDGTGTGTIQNDDVTLIAIHDVQGNGSSSPIPGAVVSVSGIVTGVRTNGFFVQAPDGDADADPNTSEGVFVFTSTAPPAAAVVGAQVQVTATVTEFVPDPGSALARRSRS